MKKILLILCLTAVLFSGCGNQNATFETETPVEPEAAAGNLQTSEEMAVTENNAATETTSGSSEENNLTEQEQIQNLLQESHKIFFDYVLGKEMQNRVDWNRSVTIPGTNYDMPIYEIADGDVLSIADMQDKMRPFFTDKMIDYIFEECNYYYHEENGRLYVSDGIGSEGGGVGVDTVHITSMEMTDDDTFILYMTEFGAGENWGLDDDLTENFTVTLKRTDNGFKIDECDKSAVNSLAWCYVPEDDVF